MALDTGKATVTLRDITATFVNAVQAATPFYPQISYINPSRRLDEKYGMLGNLPGIREWLGDRRFEEVRAATFIIANKLWESSLRISKTDLQDDIMGMYGPLAAELGTEAAYHPDQLLMAALQLAPTTACFDSQYFFDTDHLWGDSGSQSNALTGAAATGTNPTVAEFQSAFQSCVTAMLNFKRDNGQPFIRPVVGTLSDLVLLIPPTYRQTAYTALTAAVISQTTNIVVDMPKIVCSPYLEASPFSTTADRFFLFNTNSLLKPFVFQAREPLSYATKGLDDLETKDVKFMTQARYNIGYFAWWNAVQYVFT